MHSSIQSQESAEGRGRRPCARGSRPGAKLTVLLLLAGLVLLTLLFGIVRGLA